MNTPDHITDESAESAENRDAVPRELHGYIGRAAIEGVPVAAMSRIFLQDMGETYVVLNYLQSVGTIVEVPAADWPPTARRADRVPQLNGKPQAADVQFAAQRLFKLTKLEAGFLATLLRCDHADKSILHGIIEQQRFERAQRPNKLEATDPKMVDVIICKLRKKLKDYSEAFAGAVKTIWGGGYFIDASVKAGILAALNGTGDDNAGAEGNQEAVPPGTAFH